MSKTEKEMIEEDMISGDLKEVENKSKNETDHFKMFGNGLGTATSKESILDVVRRHNDIRDFEIKKPNKYQRKVKSTTIDVYDVLKAFEVNNPATAHAIKKLLASGKRGYKDIIQDLQEAIQSIERAIELESGD